jgi:hypothetical protein
MGPSRIAVRADIKKVAAATTQSATAGDQRGRASSGIEDERNTLVCICIGAGCEHAEDVEAGRRPA